MKMKKLLTLVLAAVLFSSCSVQKMNEYHCKRCATQDSVTVKTIEKVEYITEYMMIPPDSQYTFIECDSPKIIYHTQPGKVITQRVFIQGKKVFVNCNVNTDSIAYQSKVRTIQQVKETLKKQTIHVQKSFNKWNSFVLIMGYIFLILLVLVLIYFAIKAYLKTQGK